ncbi:hypothetical protein KBI23_19585 [bacterium]|nr:hypothetical protein [bacterium]MBP9811631.1 hypothetical protein [bacterium]MDP3508998.1 hypothetical protein [Candidatus Melainabacteria bacterium]
MATGIGFYWGFRQIRLGKSLANSRLDPGVAVLQGPYFNEKEAEAARLMLDSAWDTATSQVFQASSKEEAQSRIEELTPKKDSFPSK